MNDKHAPTSRVETFSDRWRCVVERTPKTLPTLIVIGKRIDIQVLGLEEAGDFSLRWSRLTRDRHRLEIEDLPAFDGRTLPNSGG